jgi:hypothetical protein
MAASSTDEADRFGCRHPARRPFAADCASRPFLFRVLPDHRSGDEAGHRRNPNMPAAAK